MPNDPSPSADSSSARDLAEVEDWFTYHAPNPYQRDMMEAVGGMFLDIARFMVTNIKPSRERSIFLTDLRQARMLANQAIAFDR